MKEDKKIKLKIFLMNGTELNRDVDGFEFRTNQMSNWILLKIKGYQSERIYDVATIQTISESMIDYL